MNFENKPSATHWYYLTKSKDTREAALAMIRSRRYQLALELGGNAGQGSEVEYAGRLRELSFLESALNKSADDYYKDVLRYAKSNAES